MPSGLPHSPRLKPSSIHGSENKIVSGHIRLWTCAQQSQKPYFKVAHKLGAGHAPIFRPEKMYLYREWIKHSKIEGRHGVRLALDHPHSFFVGVSLVPDHLASFLTFRAASGLNEKPSAQNWDKLV